MPLIESPRHSTADLARWRLVELEAWVWSRTERHAAQVARSKAALMAFQPPEGAYAGVSWGKDSTVLAALVADVRPDLPLVWVRVEPIRNPDCFLVRDAFLTAHPGVRYDEIEVWCSRDERGWHATGTLERGFREAVRWYGPHHVSGIRAGESEMRARRMRSLGLEGRWSLAPLGWWTAQDVWAYLVAQDLPIHPAYACLYDGLLDPGRVRVASLDGLRGTGHGRAEWERRYYREEIDRLHAGHQATGRGPRMSA